MIPKILSFIFVLFSSSLVNAQWSSFDLDEVNPASFETDVDPFLKSISLSSARHFLAPFNIAQRINIGISYSRGINLSSEKYSSERMSGYPALASEILITSNLKLKGSLSTLRSGDDLIQVFSFGFGLNLSNKKQDNWRASAVFSDLSGPADLRNKTVDLLIIKEFKIKTVPLIAGIGLNSYNTKILIDNIESIPNSIKGNANYFFISAIFSKGKFIFTPNMQLNSKVAMISLELSGGFK